MIKSFLIVLLGIGFLLIPMNLTVCYEFDFFEESSNYPTLEKALDHCIGDILIEMISEDDYQVSCH